MIQQHEIQVRVRYQETDAQGIVHHANYFNYFEMGRIELLRACGMSYREFENNGWMLVVSEISCRYYRPAQYDDVLTLTTTTVRAQGARLEHQYVLARDGEVLAKGESRIACVDRGGNVRRLPAALQMDENKTRSVPAFHSIRPGLSMTKTPTKPVKTAANR